ncbi:MAG: tetraacyldisaccharide 4'-kinase [Pseudomonadota bacterium]
MSFDPPGFWSARPGTSTAAKLLRPLGALYHAEVQRRLASTRPFKASVPVICVGNATMGGVGKTPFVRWLSSFIRARGRHPHILTRGYGGTAKGPVLVTEGLTAAEVGDEPLLLSSAHPVWVSRDRAAGAAEAAQAGAELIIMDDGLQNPKLFKDLSFLLVDAEALFGNGEVFPAGPLREWPAAARDRCQAVVAMLPSTDSKTPRALKTLAAGRPLIEAWFAIDETSVPEGPLVAACGIGRPERFFQSLAAVGADLVGAEAFPDHHPFSPDEITALREKASQLGATLVMTEKDVVRLPAAERAAVAAIRGGIAVRNEAQVLALLEKVI